MLSDKKILITGVTGQIGFPLARFLAEKNEVWGVARFTDEQNKPLNYYNYYYYTIYSVSKKGY